MNLMDILQGQISDDMLGQLSNHIGATPQQTAQATNGVFATLIGGLANNASSQGGLSSLSAALDRDHDGSVVDDLGVEFILTGKQQLSHHVVRQQNVRRVGRDFQAFFSALLACVAFDHRFQGVRQSRLTDELVDFL